MSKSTTIIVDAYAALRPRFTKSQFQYDSQNPLASSPNTTSLTSGTCVCLSCKALMKTPGVCSVDAGQAYEEIPHDYVSRSTSHIIKKFGGPNFANKTLTVYNQQTVVAHKGGSLNINLSDRVVLRLQKLQEVVDMILGLRNYALGNATLSQTIGIPIGGPLSTVLLDIPLSCSEHHFDVHLWPPIAESLGIPGWARAETFTATRFADNTFSASPWLCAECLAKLMNKCLHAVYSL